MSRNESTEGTGELGGGRSAKRRKAVRYGVPVAAAGVIAATIGLVPAFAGSGSAHTGSGSAHLPKISAKALMAKMAKADVKQFSGTVQLTGESALHGGGKGAGAAASLPSKSGTHTVQVAADGPEKQRMSVDGKTLIQNGTDLWKYNSDTNIAVHGKGDINLKELVELSTPQGATELTLEMAGGSSSATVGGTTKVAGRDAYQLDIKLKQNKYADSMRVAVDAANGVPLKVTTTSKSGDPAPGSVGYTRVDFTKPAASTFAPPKGATIVEGDQKAAKADRERGEGR
jgi:outer membrane lipoprotein-sorting protein